MNRAIGIQLLLGPRPITSLEEYLAGGGGEGLARALELGPDRVIAEVSLSGLRGRGGAGFPTGTKWASVQSGGGRHHYAVCNGVEGEPATFKDRALLRANPYQVVEGLAIAALAVDAREVFIALKSSFQREQEATERALGQMREAGLLGEMPVRLVSGPEEYLFGEEKALLEVIEGNDPLPRWLPPYLHGLFATVPQLGWEAHDPEQGHLGAHYANPILVNNVETLANVPHILARGSEWFRSMGTPDSPGTVVCTVVGDVRRPDVVEVELGTELGEVLDHCGGPCRDGASGPFSLGYPTRCSRGSKSAPGSATRTCRQPAPDWGLPASSCTTTPPAWSRSRGCSRASSMSSPAGSAFRASSARGRSPRPSTGSPPDRAAGPMAG